MYYSSKQSFGYTGEKKFDRMELMLYLYIKKIKCYERNVISIERTMERRPERINRWNLFYDWLGLFNLFPFMVWKYVLLRYVKSKTMIKNKDGSVIYEPYERLTYFERVKELFYLFTILPTIIKVLWKRKL